MKNAIAGIGAFLSEVTQSVVVASDDVIASVSDSLSEATQSLS